MKIAAILLAAGSAKRMGKPKQLLSFHGTTLVEHAARQALESGFYPVIAVIGAEADLVEKVLQNYGVEICRNSVWTAGMGSSIAAGMRWLGMERSIEAVAILVADQPLVRANQLLAMAQIMEQSQAQAVAAHYANVLGVPAIFKRELFPRLLSLPPEAGAQRLLRDPEIKPIAFDLPEAAVDIDTPEEFETLISLEDPGCRM